MIAINKLLETRFSSNFVFLLLGVSIGWFSCKTLVVDNIRPTNNITNEASRNIKPVEVTETKVKETMAMSEMAASENKELQDKVKKLQSLLQDAKNAKPKKIYVKEECKSSCDAVSAEYERVNSEWMRIYSNSVREANK